VSDNQNADLTTFGQWTEHASDRPDLLPPLELMRREHIEILEDWYTWSVEWVVQLRCFAELRKSSAVLEIGCGLGRIAYSMRDYLSLGGGTYDGFDISDYKIGFLEKTLTQLIRISASNAQISAIPHTIPQEALMVHNFNFPMLTRALMALSENL
jgi:SAM-dependent methyltransferase